MKISNEAIALFVRFWLTTTPTLADTAQAAAQAKSRERYEGFVQMLGRRLARGDTLVAEITAEMNAGNSSVDLLLSGSSGLGCHADPSPPTPSAFSSMRSCCGRRRRQADRRPAMMAQTPAAEVRWMKAKQRLAASRAKQPDDLAAKQGWLPVQSSCALT